MSGTYHLAPSVLRADLDAEEVLLNTVTGRYHVLNGTGKVVVAALEAGQPTTVAAAQLAERYGAALADVERDVAVFLDALAARGLIEPLDEAG